MKITVEEVLANPGKYGVPTVQEFAKNPDKWRDTLDKKLARFDQSTQTFKNIVEKQTYKIAGYEVRTLEEVERIARDEGIRLLDCNFAPQIVPSGNNGKCKIVVEFRRKGLSRILDFAGRPFKR